MDFEEKILNDVKAEYNYYQSIKLLVDKVGVAFEAMPEGLLLEVRAFTGHIADAITRKDDTEEDRLANTKTARHHLRRIELDCYKALCVYEFLQIKEFEKKYRFYNLSDVDDGNFVQHLEDLKKVDEDANREAKALDLNGNNTKHSTKSASDDKISRQVQENEFDELYDAYQKAFNAYCKVTNYIEAHRAGASRIARKNLILKIVSVLGWVISLGVSVAFGVVSC